MHWHTHKIHKENQVAVIHCEIIDVRANERANDRTNEVATQAQLKNPTQTRSPNPILRMPRVCVFGIDLRNRLNSPHSLYIEYTIR